MSIDEIINCATVLAELLGLHITDKWRLKKNIKKKIPVTTFYFNKEFTLWVDRFFIAYSQNGYLDVWYIYISKEHIKEELREIKALLRGNVDFLWYIQLSNIREQTREALRSINTTSMDSYIFHDNLKELQRIRKGDG